jgi:hypothetical protein
MSGPVGRGRGALSAIMATVMSVITLPFRVLGRLFGGGRRRPMRRL